ncbi:MAG: diaminopimelate epimerase [Candidatus Omnitrophica bacterium]|nr:diaminopimelate epimerase [Candidatus Omnitrophota bacterium]
MRKINFTKMVASGNDFVVATESGLRGFKLGPLAKTICDRRFGAGADGLLVMGRSRKAGVRMRIFNADGSEAEMCGNGARCAALFAKSKISSGIETIAGIIEARVKNDSARIKLTDPRNIKLNIPIKIGSRIMKVNFLNTGVPHVVIFVQGLDKLNVGLIGRFLRRHRRFAPAGTNVNFIEVLGTDSIAIRTYERGVEDETLACGTGSTASAIVFALKGAKGSPIKLKTKGGDVLKVYFDKTGDKFTNVWLEGPARKVYEGEYYV